MSLSLNFKRLLNLAATALLMLCVSPVGHAQTADYYQLAKAYSALQYFYPEPALVDFPWDNFLVAQVNNILNDSFNLEAACREVAPAATFLAGAVPASGQLPASNLEDNYYYQHFGGIETANQSSSPDLLMKSLLIGGDLKSFSMLSNLLTMSAHVGKRVKISFRAKWECDREGSALVMLHCGFKANGRVESRYHKVRIKPTLGWQYYQLDTLFCGDCPDKVFTSLKIVRPEYDTLLLDDLVVATTNEDPSANVVAWDTVFQHGFENYDTLYRHFREYESFTLSDKIAPRPSKDCYSGKFALQLIGNQHLSLYPQQQLDSFIRVSLEEDYHLVFPRFLAKFAPRPELKEVAARYAALPPDSLPDRAVYIADLIKLWTTAENAYPYRHIRDNVDAVALLERCIHKATERDYNATAHFHNIVLLHSAYRDPHHNPFWEEKQAWYPPVIPQIVDGTYRLGLVYDEQYRPYFGKAVTHINGKEIGTWFEERLYDKAAIQSTHLLNNAMRYLCQSFDEKPAYRFTLADGEELAVDSDALVQGQKKLLYPYSYLQDTIKIIGNNDAVYIRITPFGKWDTRDDKRKHFLRDSLPHFPWIILDQRNSHINYTSDRVIEFKKVANYLFVQPDRNSIIDAPFKDSLNFIALDIADIGRYEFYKAGFNSKIIVLVNENTRSAPERSLLPLYDAGLVTLIGQPTAGTAGFAIKLRLPSGIEVSFTMGNAVHQSGEPYQDKGLQPHYLITDSLSEQDLGLLKALELISDGK